MSLVEFGDLLKENGVALEAIKDALGVVSQQIDSVRDQMVERIDSQNARFDELARLIMECDKTPTTSKRQTLDEIDYLIAWDQVGESLRCAYGCLYADWLLVVAGSS